MPEEMGDDLFFHFFLWDDIDQGVGIVPSYDLRVFLALRLWKRYAEEIVEFGDEISQFLLLLHFEN